jgi:hypothetical protein
MKPSLRTLAVLIAGGCCSMPDFNVGDMDGRLDFSWRLAFDFDFDADMEFDFDADFAGWAGFGAATAVNLGIDLSGKVAYEFDIDIDIDDDGVKESLSVLGFGDGDPDDIDIVVAAWKGDVYTFDDGYCYVLVANEDTVTLLTGPCDEDGPVLTCTSPAADRDEVSCEVCDEAGRCTQCDGTTVEECISDGAEELDDLPEPEPEETAAGSLRDAGSDGMDVTTNGTDIDASAPDPSAADAGTTASATTTAQNDASSDPTGSTEATGSAEPATSNEPEPDPAESEAYRTCMDQLSVIEASISLCGLSLTLDSSELCEGHIGAVQACFSSIDGLGFLDSPCDELESDDCTEVVE